jgi:hypothetical protein
VGIWRERIGPIGEMHLKGIIADWFPDMLLFFKTGVCAVITALILHEDQVSCPVHSSMG